MRKRLAALLCAASVLCLPQGLRPEYIPAAEQPVAYEAAVSSGGFFTSDDPSVKTDTARVKWRTKINKGIRNGFPSCVFDGDFLYTAAVDRIYKINRHTGETLKTTKLDSQIAYTYFMTAADGMVFIQLANGAVQAFSADTLAPLWTSSDPVCAASGQGLSPIVYDGGYIYASTVVMSKKLGTGSIFCIDVSAAQNGRNDFVWQNTPLENSSSASGFYRAGPAVMGDKIIYGSEGGTLYMADKHSGEITDTADIEGDIRSTAVYDGGNVYFTAKSGYIYAVEADENGFGAIRRTKFCEDSTCEPVIYGGKIYAGGSSGSYSNGVFCVFSQNDLSETARFEVSGNVQAKPLLRRENGGTAVYFNCNYTPGRMMRLYDGADGISLSEFFVPDEADAQYCINQVTEDADGTLYYQNDSGCLTALEPPNAAVPPETTETSTAAAETLSETVSESTETTTAKSTSHSGGGGSHTADTITVGIEVTGDDVHGPSGHKAYPVWINGAEYKFKSGTTAEDAIKKVLDENGYGYVIQNNGYLSEVTTPDGTVLAEFSNGVNSGWMYTVNGEFPQTAMRNYKLSDGDSLVFMYTDDYTVQDRASRNIFSSDTETASEQTTAAAPDTAAEETAQTEEASVNTEFDFFDDVEYGIWYFYPVECLHAAGIVNGRDDGLFHPGDNVTRAEFTAMLYRIYGEQGLAADFADTPADAWYSAAVGWAKKRGVVYGTDNTHFSPDLPVTRQDAAAMLYRLCEQDGRYTAAFDDSADIAPYAANAVAALTQKGIISGTDKNLFLPRKNAARAETAVILFNFIEKEFIK